MVGSQPVPFKVHASRCSGMTTNSVARTRNTSQKQKLDTTVRSLKKKVEIAIEALAARQQAKARDCVVVHL